MQNIEESRVVKKYEVHRTNEFGLQQQTFENKEKAIDFLSNNAGDGKVYVFYYSKHGKGEAFDVKVVATKINDILEIKK